MLKQKIYLLLENLVQLNDSNFGSYSNNSDFVRYLFHLIVFLKPDFNCCYNFALFRVDKVTTGT